MAYQAMGSSSTKLLDIVLGETSSPLSGPTLDGLLPFSPLAPLLVLNNRQSELASHLSSIATRLDLKSCAPISNSQWLDVLLPIASTSFGDMRSQRNSYAVEGRPHQDAYEFWAEHRATVASIWPELFAMDYSEAWRGMHLHRFLDGTIKSLWRAANLCEAAEDSPDIKIAIRQEFYQALSDFFVDIETRRPHDARLRVKMALPHYGFQSFDDARWPRNPYDEHTTSAQMSAGLCLLLDQTRSVGMRIPERMAFLKWMQEAAAAGHRPAWDAVFASVYARAMTTDASKLLSLAAPVRCLMQEIALEASTSPARQGSQSYPRL
jgi:hypothetical protein